MNELNIKLFEPEEEKKKEWSIRSGDCIELCIRICRENGQTEEIVRQIIGRNVLKEILGIINYDEDFEIVDEVP
jgi:hypothetical protein